MAIVTDVVWKDKGGNPRVGYYMNSWLAQNLDGIPQFIKKAWDVVGIISGHGKVRIGKSTAAQQIAYYIAWLMAGGEMDWETQDEKKKYLIKKHPTKPVNFSMENIVFSPDELVDRAQKLPKNSVIVYDEGRAGLDSARAMENVNKGMQDFFQECGVYGHIILIVLPDFFKLHEDYAISRSLFLVDVYTDSKFQRGYFNFYNEKQKEWLYQMGKRRIGTSNKYASSRYSFWGRFTGWLPLDKDIYENEKKKALAKKTKLRKDKLAYQHVVQRNAMCYLLQKYTGWSLKEIAEKMLFSLGIEATSSVLKEWVDEMKGYMEETYKADNIVLVPKEEIEKNKKRFEINEKISKETKEKSKFEEVNEINEENIKKLPPDFKKEFNKMIEQDKDSENLPP